MIKLGQEVKDIVTGFTGIITSKVEYLNGCVQFCVHPKVKAGESKRPEGEYIDEGQLEVIGKGVKVSSKVEDLGGLMSDTPHPQYRG